MNTRLGGVLVATLVAASVGMAPVAKASEAPPWPLSCADDSPSRPAPGTVYIDGEGLHVNLDSVDPDIQAATQWATDFTLYWASCIASRVPTAPVFCLAGVATNIGSYVNVNPPQIDIYYPALAQAIADCALSG